MPLSYGLHVPFTVAMESVHVTVPEALEALEALPALEAK
jgi:hypothetical protein